MSRISRPSTIHSRYNATRRHWNEVFAGLALFDPKTPLADSDVESALQWVSMGAHSIIDFGCGNGRALLRSLVLGVEQGVGIDISDSAISLAKNTARESWLQGRAVFRRGDMSLLSRLSPASFDSGILFNIVDNLFPEDAILVLNEYRRLVKLGGKILLKLNDFVEPTVLETEYEAEQVTGRLYREKTGLYFWDLDDGEARALLARPFALEEFSRVQLGESDHSNRMYYLRRQ
jgi:arsenite methyltransferase